MKELPEELQARILAYVEGELPPDQAAALEVLLANTDPALAELVAGMLADRHGLQHLAKLTAPHDLAGRTMEHIERQSLITGIEHDVHGPAWWQSRTAIAAGVALVIGGFSWFVVSTITRPKSEWNKPVAGGGAGSPTVAVAPSGPAGESRQAPVGTPTVAVDAEAAKLAGTLRDSAAEASVLNRVSREAQQVAQSGAPIVTKAGAPKALVEDLKNSVEERIQRSRELLAKRAQPASARKADEYIAEGSAQGALAAVHASKQNWVDGPPVILTLVARDARDSQRLATALAQFRAADQAASSAPRRSATGWAGKGGGGGFARPDPHGSGDKPTAQVKPTPTAEQVTLPSPTGAAPRAGVPGTVAEAVGGPAGQANQQQMDVPSGNLPEQLNATAQVMRPAPAGAYRVFLRPEQLDQLTRDFKVLSIGRGQAAYVIEQKASKDRSQSSAGAPAAPPTMQAAGARGYDQSQAANPRGSMPVDNQFNPALNAAREQQSARPAKDVQMAQRNEESTGLVEVIVSLENPTPAATSTK